MTKLQLCLPYLTGTFGICIDVRHARACVTIGLYCRQSKTCSQIAFAWKALLLTLSVHYGRQWQKFSQAHQFKDAFSTGLRQFGGKFKDWACLQHSTKMTQPTSTLTETMCIYGLILVFNWALRKHLLMITPRFQPFTLCVCGSRFVFLSIAP